MCKTFDSLNLSPQKQKLNSLLKVYVKVIKENETEVEFMP